MNNMKNLGKDIKTVLITKEQIENEWKNWAVRLRKTMKEKMWCLLAF